MTEPQLDFYGKILKQAERLKKGFNVVDEVVFHETFAEVKRIYDLYGKIVPNHKIKFLLQSPDLDALKSRIPKLGKRFFTE